MAYWSWFTQVICNAASLFRPDRRSFQYFCSYFWSPAFSINELRTLCRFSSVLFYWRSMWSFITSFERLQRVIPTLDKQLFVWYEEDQAYEKAFFFSKSPFFKGSIDFRHRFQHLFPSIGNPRHSRLSTRRVFQTVNNFDQIPTERNERIS